MKQDSPVLFDTHCHLDSAHFPEGEGAVLSRARTEAVAGFACIGVGGTGAMRDAVRIAEQNEDVWATVGVHPHDAADFDDVLEQELVAHLGHPRVVALGECGLDYHYDHSPRPRQREVFARMIALGRAHRKPLVIHTRSAAEETLELLVSEGARDVGGIIHCFSEDRAFAARALELGFDLSFSGIVTFKSAVSVQDVARWAPIENVLVETDSPYLAPVPLRGRRCEPAHVAYTARHIAALRGADFEELCAATTANAVRRFDIRRSRA